MKVGHLYWIIEDEGDVVERLGICIDVSPSAMSGNFVVHNYVPPESNESLYFKSMEVHYFLNYKNLSIAEQEWIEQMAAHINEEVLREIIARKQQPAKPAEPEKPKEEVKVKPLVIPEGWKAYTEVFGKTATGRDHPVKMFSDTDWPEHLRGYIPEPDPNYVFPQKATEVFVVGLMNQHDKMFIHGPKGSGKSSLTEQVCARLRIPFIRVNCREDMESSAIFGSITIKDGTMGWAAGPAEELGLHGGVLQVDEISATPAGINMAMQGMLEENGKIYLADKPVSAEEKFIKPHPWFRIVATDNTQLQGDASGHYAGTQVQNEALADRFTTTIELGYLSKAHETEILKGKCPDLPAGNIKDMLELAAMIRTGYTAGKIQFTMSPRTLINWGRKTEYWGDPIMALQIAFFDKLVEDDKKQINALCQKVFAKEVK